MKLRQLFYEVAAKCGAAGSRDVEPVVRALAEVVIDAASRGERVTVPGLGVFRARARKERAWASPTGGQHVIPARFVLTFRASESVRVLRANR